MQLKKLFTNLIILGLFILTSCNRSRVNGNSLSPAQTDVDTTDYVLSTRNYFFLEKDSIRIISETSLKWLYYCNLEPYQHEYSTSQEFINDFLLNRNGKFSNRLAEVSTMVKTDKSVLSDYKVKTFDAFFRKYCQISKSDTILINNNITVAFCLDKHSMDCPFCDVSEEPVKVIKR